jgi:hypothetical protein
MKKPRKTGSTTNASDAVDDMRLPPRPTTEQRVDEGVKETFPASDPVSVSQPKAQKTVQPPAPEKRSPDWLLDKH